MATWGWATRILKVFLGACVVSGALAFAPSSLRSTLSPSPRAYSLPSHGRDQRVCAFWQQLRQQGTNQIPKLNKNTREDIVMLAGKGRCPPSTATSRFALVFSRKHVGARRFICLQTSGPRKSGSVPIIRTRRNLRLTQIFLRHLALTNFCTLQYLARSKHCAQELTRCVKLKTNSFELCVQILL